MSALTLQSIQSVFGGDISGNGILIPGPGHSKRDRSLSITLSSTSPNGFLLNSFCGDDDIICLDYFRAKMGLPAFGLSRRRDKSLPGSLLAQPTEAANENVERARVIWRESVDIYGSLAETYLGSSDELPEHDSNSGEQYEASVVCEELVVSGCDAPELLQFIEETLDEIALLVERLVVGERRAAIGF